MQLMGQPTAASSSTWIPGQQSEHHPATRREGCPDKLAGIITVSDADEPAGRTAGKLPKRVRTASCAWDLIFRTVPSDR